ncbi:hypothetical protein HYW42_01685 [Candidatus Daviesbacteria bacterium]|nr:hypothetical protein [Candidatus Daviesbacteria bacterium]
MKASLFGKRSDELTPLLEPLGFNLTDSNPEVIITYGGDGTLLSAESRYPQIPKLAIRDNSICVKCTPHKDVELFRKLKDGHLKLTEFAKLEASFEQTTLTAVNDFVIRNQLPIHAIRFLISKNGEQVTDKLIIGDGAVVATEFGASGYYKSITHQTFSNGFYGVALNNTTEKLKPILFKQKDLVKIKLLRGPATLSFDNNPDIYTLENNTEVSFKSSDKIMRLFQSDTLRCPNCRVNRMNY